MWGLQRRRTSLLQPNLYGHAVKNALKLKEIDPHVNIYVLYRDVRTYGFYETYYHEARGKGVIFIRYDLENKPEVTLRDGKLQVSLFDPAMGSQVTLPADRVILSAGVEPHDNQELARIFDVDLNPDGFFMEANPKSAPLDSVDHGKFYCGLCHSPNFIEDAISQGNAAAARAATILFKGGNPGEGLFGLCDQEALLRMWPLCYRLPLWGKSSQ